MFSDAANAPVYRATLKRGRRVLWTRSGKLAKLLPMFGTYGPAARKLTCGENTYLGFANGDTASLVRMG